MSVTVLVNSLMQEGSTRNSILAEGESSHWETYLKWDFPTTVLSTNGFKGSKRLIQHSADSGISAP